MFLGLRTVIDPAPDLAAARGFFVGVPGTAPSTSIGRTLSGLTSGATSSDSIPMRTRPTGRCPTGACPTPRRHWRR